MNQKVMKVQPNGWVACVADILMVPIMYVISVLAGAWDEEPQRTHAWNVQTLTVEEAERIRQCAGRVDCKGVKDALVRQHWWDMILFHLPFLKKGWRQYVVLAPETSLDDLSLKWHVGWLILDAKVQISKIPISQSIRMLLGPGDVSFFGVTEDGNHIPIRLVGRGRIGDHGEFRKVPLN